MNITSILDGLVSHALASGWFMRVNQHEPKSAPIGTGLTAAIWVQRISPVVGSGLATTSGRLEFTERIYQNMLSEPQDSIDPTVISAVDVLMTAYSGDFELNGLVRNVDLIGTYGPPLSAQAGYLNQSGVMFRVMDITLPLIVNDLWTQAA